MKRTRLNIYEYTDFRKFLSDRLKELKKLDNRYSLRFLSDRIGLSSKSHLKMVADGSRNLSMPLASKLGRAIGLADPEASFFTSLVRYGQAKSTAEQEAALEELRRKRKFIDVHRLELDHFDYLSDPLALTLREMVTFPDFKEEPKWIMERLPMKATPKVIREAIEKLIRLGLIRRDGKGQLTVSNLHHSTGDGFKSVALKRFYENTFKQAADSLRQSPERRHLGGLTMAISRRSYEQIISLYKDFNAQVRAIADDDNDADQVYQLIVSLFPMTR